MGILADIETNINKSDGFVTRRMIFDKAFNDSLHLVFNGKDWDGKQDEVKKHMPTVYQSALFIKGSDMLKQLTIYNLYHDFNWSTDMIISFCDPDKNEYIEDYNDVSDNFCTIGNYVSNYDSNRYTKSIDVTFISNREKALTYLNDGHFSISVTCGFSRFNTDLFDVVNNTCPYFESIPHLGGKDEKLIMYETDAIVRKIEKLALSCKFKFKTKFFDEYREYIKELINNN